MHRMLFSKVIANGYSRRFLIVLIALQILVLYILLKYSVVSPWLQPNIKYAGLDPGLLTASAGHIQGEGRISVVIGLAFTLKGSTRIPSAAIGIRSPFFRSLLPSFCRTASVGYDYRFYLGYDNNDKHMTRDVFRKAFQNMFELYVGGHCPAKSSYHITFVQCNHSGNPPWAQNDAMIQA